MTLVRPIDDVRGRIEGKKATVVGRVFNVNISIDFNFS